MSKELTPLEACRHLLTTSTINDPYDRKCLWVIEKELKINQEMFFLLDNYDINSKDELKEALEFYQKKKIEEKYKGVLENE